MVPFAGYEMPVQYPSGILAEHQAVRAGVGLFDISHIGEFEITGPDGTAFLNRVTCNDVSAVKPGGVQYSSILTPEGTFVDDCTLYRFDDKWMVVVNASTAAAWKHFVDHKDGANVRLKDISDEVGLLALQGPRAQALLQPLTAVPLDHAARGGAGLDRQVGQGRAVRGRRGAPRQKQRGIGRKLVGFRLEGRGLPRPGLAGLARRPGGGSGAERRHEPLPQRPDRHHVPTIGRGGARHPLRGGGPRRAAPRRGGAAAFLDRGIGAKVDVSA
jgi:glycine cleavage system aminomethyltransferase T